MSTQRNTKADEPVATTSYRDREDNWPLWARPAIYGTITGIFLSNFHTTYTFIMTIVANFNR